MLANFQNKKIKTDLEKIKIRWIEFFRDLYPLYREDMWDHVKFDIKRLIASLEYKISKNKYLSERIEILEEELKQLQGQQ